MEREALTPRVKRVAGFFYKWKRAPRAGGQLGTEEQGASNALKHLREDATADEMQAMDGWLPGWRSNEALNASIYENGAIGGGKKTTGVGRQKRKMAQTAWFVEKKSQWDGEGRSPPRGGEKSPADDAEREELQQEEEGGDQGDVRQHNELEGQEEVDRAALKSTQGRRPGELLQEDKAEEDARRHTAELKQQLQDALSEVESLRRQVTSEREKTTSFSQRICELQAQVNLERAGAERARDDVTALRELMAQEQASAEAKDHDEGHGLLEQGSRKRRRAEEGGGEQSLQHKEASVKVQDMGEDGNADRDGQSSDDDKDDDDDEEEAVNRSEEKSLLTKEHVAETQEGGEAEEYHQHGEGAGCGPLPSSTDHHVSSVPWSCEETTCTEPLFVWTPRREELVYGKVIWRRPRDASSRAEQYQTSYFQLKNREAATVCCVLAGSHGSEGGGLAFRGFLKRELSIAVGEREADLDDRLARAVRNSVDFLVASTDMDEEGLPQEPQKLAAAILIRGRVVLACIGRGMIACTRLAPQAAPRLVQDEDVAADQASVAVYGHGEVEGYVLASEGLMGRGAAEQEVRTKKQAIMKLVKEGGHLPGLKEIVELGDSAAGEFIVYSVSHQLKS